MCVGINDINVTSITTTTVTVNDFMLTLMIVMQSLFDGEMLGIIEIYHTTVYFLSILFCF